MITILYILLLALFAPSHAATTKRGLIYISNKNTGDDSIWDRPGSDLTWYYNYGASPTSEYTKSNLEFVPMLWGVPSSSGSFYNTVKSLKDSGVNITYVLGFNEPDGTSSQGGSNIAPDKAASIWIKEIEPLKSLGIKLGAPACQGSPSGTDWLSSFIYNCKGNCTIDFIPVHWYGNFEGFASHVGEIYAAFGNKTIWATEFALSSASLADSQTFYNQSSSFLDQLYYVDRYSYFGSFRSSVSNIGPNAAMLTQNGQLTDIGSWYLGGSATGNIPAGDAMNLLPSSAWILLTTLLCLWNIG